MMFCYIFSCYLTRINKMAVYCKILIKSKIQTVKRFENLSLTFAEYFIYYTFVKCILNINNLNDNHVKFLLRHDNFLLMCAQPQMFPVTTIWYIFRCYCKYLYSYFTISHYVTYILLLLVFTKHLPTCSTTRVPYFVGICLTIWKVFGKYLR